MASWHSPTRGPAGKLPDSHQLKGAALLEQAPCTAVLIPEHQLLWKF